MKSHEYLHTSVIIFTILADVQYSLSTNLSLHFARFGSPVCFSMFPSCLWYVTATLMPLAGAMPLLLATHGNHPRG